MWLNDPADKLIWSAHQYFDSNLSGTYSSSFADDGGYAMRGYDFLVTFAHWCLANNVRGHVGEIGTPGDTDWLTVLDRAAAFLKQANISVSYWQGGRAVSTSDPMRLEPDDLADPVDKPQTAIITAYH
jgi:endoglucanase